MAQLFQIVYHQINMEIVWLYRIFSNMYRQSIVNVTSMYPQSIEAKSNLNLIGLDQSRC